FSETLGEYESIPDEIALWAMDYFAMQHTYSLLPNQIPKNLIDKCIVEIKQNSDGYIYRGFASEYEYTKSFKLHHISFTTDIETAHAFAEDDGDVGLFSYIIKYPVDKIKIALCMDYIMKNI